MPIGESIRPESIDLHMDYCSNYNYTAYPFQKSAILSINSQPKKKHTLKKKSDALKPRALTFTIAPSIITAISSKDISVAKLIQLLMRDRLAESSDDFLEGIAFAQM